MGHKSKPRIAVVHPWLKPGGGSEAKALWLCEALKANYEVWLLTQGEVDLGQLNCAYGTRLSPQEIRVQRYPVPLAFRQRFDAWRGLWLARRCRRLAPEFDLMISAYNPLDFGRPGIQFIGDFSFDDGLRRAFHGDPAGIRRVLYRPSFLRSLYLGLGRLLAGTRGEGWRRNLTVANSRWAGQVLKERFGLETRVVYPPVAGNFPAVPWQDRENGFVCLGRINPQKRIHEAIEILAAVRRRGHDIHLHIVGWADDRKYERVLRRLCAKNAAWAFLEGPLFGPAKDSFLARHRYGISACRNEAFGIATAEMVKAGCLAWVPQGGGQLEIVDHQALIFRDRTEAEGRIDGVLRDLARQQELRTHLAESGRQFSPQKFSDETAALVRGFLAGTSQKS